MRTLFDLEMSINGLMERTDKISTILDNYSNKY